MGRPNPQNLRPPWKPGESGNPAGRQPGTVSFKAAIRRILEERPEEVDLVARALLDMAQDREHRSCLGSVRELLDRFDGTVQQAAPTDETPRNIIVPQEDVPEPEE